MTEFVQKIRFLGNKNTSYSFAHKSGIMDLRSVKLREYDKCHVGFPITTHFCPSINLNDLNLHNLFIKSREIDEKTYDFQLSEGYGLVYLHFGLFK